MDLFLCPFFFQWGTRVELFLDCLIIIRIIIRIIIITMIIMIIIMMLRSCIAHITSKWRLYALEALPQL